MTTSFFTGSDEWPCTGPGFPIISLLFPCYSLLFSTNFSILRAFPAYFAFCRPRLQGFTGNARGGALLDCTPWLRHETVRDCEIRIAGLALVGLGGEELGVEGDGLVDIGHVQGKLEA